ncbi:MAG TPA: hypothetical protein VFH73_09470 [Polyangia bacterium]|jgi:hypothetical protein|nr:hypothetical protein [Polyangia bacterium]
MPDPRLKTYAPQAIRHLTQAGSVFADRQGVRGVARGNVPPWPGSEDLDFHGTLAAIWVWARQQRLSGDRRFVAMRSAGWAFVESVWKRFIPEGIDSGASDEAAYDCALALLGAVGERAVAPVPAGRQALIDGAARVLSTYLADLETPSEREFRDPGFLAWALITYAREVEDRGLLAGGRKFVERAFGMKAPPPWATEPAASSGLFDFSSTTATRVLAIIASEGNTPFVGAWLRERVAPIAPQSFVARRLDENTWNACSAWGLGRAYVVSTDPMFLQAYTDIMDELERRDGDRDGALGRDRSIRDPETAATFYYALAVDALITGEHLSAAPSPATPHGPRPPTPGSGGLHGRR